jgi:hypothetical protein
MLKKCVEINGRKLLEHGGNSFLNVGHTGCGALVVWDPHIENLNKSCDQLSRFYWNATRNLFVFLQELAKKKFAQKNAKRF